MNILKVINNGSPVYLMRQKPFDILNLMKGFSVEFRQDVKIVMGAFDVQGTLFITYLEQFQGFQRIDSMITPLIIKNR
jgi:hypothetical protein